MKLRRILAFLLTTIWIIGLFLPPAIAGETRIWNQKKAVDIVNSCIAQEQAGDFAWDEINWIADPQEAVRVSQKMNKPIFLFFFLKKDVGPKEAPC